jgi:hypothetical protein
MFSLNGIKRDDGKVWGGELPFVVGKISFVTMFSELS